MKSWIVITSKVCANKAAVFVFDARNLSKNIKKFEDIKSQSRTNELLMISIVSFILHVP